MANKDIVGKFTKVPNELLDNNSLSVNARFLMSYILRLDKKTWDFSLNGLAKATGISLRAVYKAFDELVEAGYCMKQWVSGGRGKCSWFYIFSASRFSTIQNSNVLNSNLLNSNVENSNVENSNVEFFYFTKNALNIRLYNNYNNNNNNKIEDLNNPILNKIKDYILAQNAKTHTPEKKTLEERTQDFYNTLIPYIEKYGKEMIRAFYDYWSEPNRSHTKMLCEMKPTFDIPRRLAKWHKKDVEEKDSHSKGGTYIKVKSNLFTHIEETNFDSISSQNAYELNHSNNG